MNKIKIGAIILENRKKKGLTQEDLSNYLGVSKPAISKWESDLCYPDITLLPILASYFNISIDDLIGYEPQLEKEDIQNFYIKICKDFTDQPLHQVMDELEQAAKKYYCCYPLLMSISLLMVNHHMLSSLPEERTAILKKALTLLQHVQKNCEDSHMMHEALFLEAYCALIIHEPESVFTLLDKYERPLSSPTYLLATAYEMAGRLEKSDQILQTGIYTLTIDLFNMLSSIIKLNYEDETRFDYFLQCLLSLDQAFSFREMHPTIILPFLLVAAEGYTVQGHYEKALEQLMTYSDVICNGIFPLTLHGSKFFNKLDNLFDSSPIGNVLPRSEDIVKQSMLDAILQNPSFMPLHSFSQYQETITKLQKNLSHTTI